MTDSGTSILAVGLLVAIGGTALIVIAGEVWSMVVQWRSQRRDDEHCDE